MGIAAVHQENARRRAIKECNREIEIDIGGEGPPSGKPGSINVNIASTLRNGEKIPNFIPRFEPDGPIPFDNGSVDRIVMQSTPISQATAGEIARMIKPGGHILLENPDTAFARRQHNQVIGAIGNKGLTQQKTVNRGRVQILVTTIGMKP